MGVNPWRDERQDILERDLSTIDTAGLSELEKSRMRMQAGDAAGRDAAVYQSVFNQNRLTLPDNPQLQGQFAKESADQAGVTSDAAATIGAQANELSAQITQQEKAQTLAALDAQSAQTTANYKWWGDTAAGLGESAVGSSTGTA